MPDTVDGDERFGSTIRHAWLLRLHTSRPASHHHLTRSGLGSAGRSGAARRGLGSTPSSMHALQQPRSQPAPDKMRSADPTRHVDAVTRSGPQITRAQARSHTHSSPARIRVAPHTHHCLMPGTVDGDERFGSTIRDAWLLRLDTSRRATHDDLTRSGLGSAGLSGAARRGLGSTPKLHACAAAATQPASARQDAHG